ncbi:MAG: prepilin-type N-terminal cleavage/methylation domain-containing protein [Planctomycetota bacterium]|nr:prepilin-type N-terminal cleavage/methylation domain-containing protein [Planctomycetota bacterium]
MTTAKTSRQAGFSFIEILVVMGIISVLVSMVVVLIPNIQEKSRQTKSKDNVRNMITIMIGERTSKVSGGWPRYSGKNFVLSLIAHKKVSIKNSQNIEMFFSPGDSLYTMEDVDLDRYKDVTKSALKNDTDFHELTSYAGRRNSSNDREHVITPADEKDGVMIICDDDDGPLHHPDGIVAGYTNGAVRFMTWDDLELPEPEDARNPEPFLGDDSEHPQLVHLWGSN